MRHRYLLAPLAALAAATLVACGGSSTDSQADNTGSGATSAGAGASTTAAGPHNNIDVRFAQMMIPHHQQALEMAKLAATRGGNPQVKQLAATIEAAQQPEVTTMTGWLTSWGQPTTMPGMPSNSGGHGGHDMGTGATMPGMMSEGDMMTLEGLTGTGFDRSFLTMMTAHHQGAIDMAKAEQTNGSFQPAIDLARSIQTSQTAEVRTMKDLLANL